ncbi:MAG: hypothetical protein JST00_37620 [Deltaproteobacteria bacterium]|nr:hypothetical protein [Deltaproteobacteria bacterium]
MSLSRFEETLLASASADTPSAERKKAARAAIMQAVVPAVGAGAVAAAAASTKAAATAGGAAKLSLVTKLVILALATAGAIGGVAAWVARSSEAPAPRTAPPVLVATAAPAETASETPQPSGPPPIALRDLPTPSATLSAMTAPPQPPARALPAPLKSAPTPSARAPEPAVDPVAAEARLLEGARACLERGDASCARAKLAEHASSFPHGALSAEAAILEARLRKIP